MINTNNNTQNPYLNMSLNNQSDKRVATPEQSSKQENISKQIEESAVKVSISMNAQIVLFSLDASQLNSENITAQSSVFDFLSGKEVENEFSLKDIGYEGKAITELSVDEANELLSENGFFGIEQTSQRVTSFVFEFAKDDIELLKKGREGLVQGFEEAQKLWGGELPEISNQTQAKTLEIMDAKIAELESKSEEE